ncbi:MAG: ABC transporter permease [Spirosomataceae bacterium]
MIRNYLKIIGRSLLKNKGYSFINIFGLAIGLSSFAFISLWIADEWSYDRFNEKSERIFRVSGKVLSDNESFEHACSAVPMGPTLKADYPEVENFVRFDPNGCVIKKGNLMFDEDGVLATEPAFFDVFSYKLTAGNPQTALKEPYTVVLTESMAKKYFANENPIGQSLHIMVYDPDGKGMDYRVTGIMPDPPKNAHFTFNFLVSFESLIASDKATYLSEAAWDNNSFYTYILLKEGMNYRNFEKKLPQFYQKHLMPLVRAFGGTKPMAEFSLMPLTDIHLKSNVRYELSPTGSRNNLSVFGTVGLFILLIAGINYVNLATARSVKRAKEVGIKKVVGATKNQLINQYLAEAVLLSLISLALAIVMCQGLQPVFYQITDKNISLFDAPGLLAFLLISSIGLGVLSGIYPAFFISSYQPVAVLKGVFASSSKGIWLRKSLVVLQFTITVILMIGIVVIHSQMTFIKNKNLGYDKEALLNLKVNGEIEVIQKFESFKHQLLENPSIKNITTSNSILVGSMGNNGMTTMDKTGKPIRSNIYRLKVDYDFIRTLGMKVAAGRNFSLNFPNDIPTDSTQNYILNEAAVKAFGWGKPEDALGKPFTMSDRNGKVIGIVSDFHFTSLQHKVEPLAMVLRDGNFSRIILKIDRTKTPETIAFIEKEWKRFFPNAYCQYDFVDKKLGEQYMAEARFSKIFFYFSVISVLIACLGLYGLTSFATEQRTKEIGIRKVLGANLSGITVLLTADFLKSVLIAVIIAGPIAYYGMDKWLQDFAYRITIEWWVFLLAGALALFIAFLTVGYQSVKAALMNPVKSLKTE